MLKLKAVTHLGILQANISFSSKQEGGWFVVVVVVSAAAAAVVVTGSCYCLDVVVVFPTHH